MGVCIESGVDYDLFLLSRNRDFTKYVFKRHYDDYVKQRFRDPKKIMESIDVDYPKELIREMARQLGYKYVVVLDDGSDYHLFFTNNLSIIGMLNIRLNTW